MKVDVQEISSIKRAIRIEVPQDVVQTETVRAYRDINKRVRWPGFRQGKTPIALLESRYAESVREDVLKKLIPDYYRKALQQTGIMPVAFPSFQKIEVDKNTPLSFTALVEIKPSIELQSYVGIELEKSESTVEEDQVDATVRHLRESHAQLEAAPDGYALAAGDIAIIDFEGNIEGKPFEGGKADNHLLEIGSGRLLPGVEEQLIGRKKGDQCRIQTTFPDDHRAEKLAGKTAILDITVREVKIKRLPEADDEFTKDIGPFSSMKELRDKIRADLESRRMQESQGAYREAVIKDLVARHTFEVPAALVEHETQSMIRQLERRVRQLGHKMSDAEQNPEALRRELEPRARDRVAARLILDAISEKENIIVTEAELDAELERIAAGMQVSKEEFKKYVIHQEGSVEGIRAGIREEKMLDFIVSRARFKDPAK